ncbi:MAG: hypothetical protein NC131_00335 [Roseburia sp.]|nr:hypothetical protein [Roseburia sp.]
MAKNKRFQKHFRKFHGKQTTGHPSYVYDENGKVYKVIGVTESPVTNGVLNIRLVKNPEPNSIKPAYIRPVPIEIPNVTKSTKLKGWKFADIDKPKVQTVIDGGYKKKPRKK